MIIGTLTVVAVPRFATTDAVYDELRLYDDTVSALRFAHRSATAMQRTVCVTFAGGHNQLTLTYAATYGSSVCATGLQAPAGTSPYTVTAQGAALYSGDTTFNFDRVGRPSVPHTITIGSRQIVIEKESGYVR